MVFIDRLLKCIDCGQEFVFSAGEQEFFQEKQFQHDPKRCKRCKSLRTGGRMKMQTEASVICAACGTLTTVPFRPRQSRPVFCRGCFESQLHALQIESSGMSAGQTMHPYSR